jgi:hypothetical protein
MVLNLVFVFDKAKVGVYNSAQKNNVFERSAADEETLLDLDACTRCGNRWLRASR